MNECLNGGSTKAVVTPATDIQREPAVAGQLVQHVVKEPNPGFRFAATARIQVDKYVDIRFIGLSFHGGLPGAVHQLMGDRRPVFITLSDPDAANTHILSQHQVRFTVTDNPAIGEVQVTGFQVVQHQADAGFPRLRILVLDVRINHDAAEGAALLGQQCQLFLLRYPVLLARNRLVVDT